MIIKNYPNNTNKLLSVAIILLVFSLFTPLFGTTSMILLGIISSVLAAIIATFLWVRSHWEYNDWDNPLFPE